ncbi:MAG: glycosyltransferase family 2 protein [Rickettsiales bacterium]|jgi:dolichol-phosphate mannosyltransferase|nr:glycosyltransferase family 2 protein [Rickettsiales bacterium]
MRDTLSIVVSAYNEQDNIRELYDGIVLALDGLDLKKREIIFVDDGSTDKTALFVRSLQKRDKSVKLVRMALNSGHNTAIFAGLAHAKSDAAVIMDADMQHPPPLIAKMARLWQKGKNIVRTRRTDNADSSRLYKFMSGIFYRLLNLASDVKIEKNAPDFMLLDRRHIDRILKFDERDFLFRGLLAMSARLDGPDSACIAFKAPSRRHGKTSYNFSKSMRLAWNGILQFSTKPLYLALWLALIFGALAFGLGMWVIIEKYMLDHPAPGYATIVCAIAFASAANMFILAIIGAYVGKIHIESKKRPLFLAEYTDAQ